MEEEFKSRLAKVISSRKGSKMILTKKKYDYLLKKVNTAKENESEKSPEQVILLKKFDVVKVGNTEKLIFPGEQDPTKRVFYAHTDELFSIFSEIHVATNHGSKYKMMKELKKKYKNIGGEEVSIYLDLCEICQEAEEAIDREIMKRVRRRKLASVRTSHDEGWHRSHFDIVDMRSHPDGDYKYIMVHKEHRTKFMILKPMKTKTSTEAASLLMEIFTLFGPPDIMHFNNGRSFGRRVLEKVYEEWEEANIILGKRTCSKILGKTVRARCGVDKMVCDWMEKHNITQWAKCLCLVQILKNMTYHNSIKCTPYEAMFGKPMPLDIEIDPQLGVNIKALLLRESQQTDTDDDSGPDISE